MFKRLSHKADHIRIINTQKYCFLQDDFCIVFTRRQLQGEHRVANHDGGWKGEAL